MVFTLKIKGKTPSTVRFEKVLTSHNSNTIVEDKEVSLRSKTGNGKGRQTGISLTQLRLELGARFVEPAVPNGTGQIRSRLQS